MVCLREVQRTLKFSAKRLLEGKIRSMGVESHFDILDSEIRNKRGRGIIIFQGMQNHNADSIKSLEDFDIAWFEEAQRASQTSLDMLRPTLRKPGSELWFTWNPDQSTDPIDVLLRGPELPPRAIVVEANFTDNPWFPEESREEMEYDRRVDPDKYAHIWLGKYRMHSEARVFRNWRVEDFDTPKDAIHRLGADWGFNDPTVMVRCHIVGRKLYVDYEAYRVNCEILDIPDLFMTIPEAEKWPSVADSNRPDTISHVQKHGFPKMVKAIKGPGSIEEGVEWLKSYEIIVHPRCVHVIDELTLYSYKVDPLTGKVLPVLEDKKNHVIDSLRYGCEGVRRSKVRDPVKVTVQPRVQQWGK
jgi:phage terminase large subunit